LRIGQEPPVEIGFSDQLWPGAVQLVAGLLAQGKIVHLLTGDVPGAVGDLARELGISHWQAEVLPAEKAAFVTGLVQAGHRVLMVGDELNDTGTLAAATMSISPASALDEARVASDIASVVDALHIAQQFRRRIKENFVIALVYNLVTV
jgi:P-type Cu2+ transporter